jgi:hypothetical protein
MNGIKQESRFCFDTSAIINIIIHVVEIKFLISNSNGKEVKDEKSFICFHNSLYNVISHVNDTMLQFRINGRK